MRKDEFREGEEWAYRANARLGAPVQRVALVAMPNRKGHIKVKVRHLEGELEGMEEFVHATHLRCRWTEWKRVAKDEAREADFLAYMNRQPELDRVVMRAANEVFASTGEDLWIDDYRNYSGVDASQVAGLEHVADRAGVEKRPWNGWPCFKNRAGDIYMPNTYLIDLAAALCRAEPETVNLYLDKEEQELVSERYILGELLPPVLKLTKSPVQNLTLSSS